MNCTLTTEGATALFDNDPETMGESPIVVLHRPPQGGRWVELGRAETMRKALDLVVGKGQFWIREPNSSISSKP